MWVYPSDYYRSLGLKVCPACGNKLTPDGKCAGDPCPFAGQTAQAKHAERLERAAANEQITDEVVITDAAPIPKPRRRGRSRKSR